MLKPITGFQRDISLWRGMGQSPMEKEIMKKIVFVCYGNICRSPMAEFVMKDMVKKKGLQEQFMIESRATSAEEIGSPVHYGTKGILDSLGISTRGKTAAQLTKADYGKYDLIIGMDERNMRSMLRLFGEDTEGKVRKLLEKDVADPWYTGDFEATYRDVKAGCEYLLEALKDQSAF